MFEKQINNSKLILMEGDITKEKVDAIVNAANPELMGGGGVDGAIHRAGGPAIIEECKKIRAKHGRLLTGQAVITTAGKLKAKYVIHTVGPVWNGGDQHESQLLRSCYLESLQLAADNGCESIAFPSISTGIYGYPLDKAAQVSLKAVIDFLKEDSRIKEVRFVLFNFEAFLEYQEVLE